MNILKRKPKRQRKWTGMVDITGVGRKEAERRFWLSYKKSFIEPLLKMPPKEREEALKDWIEGVKDRTEEMAHEEVKPYREYKTKSFSKMPTPELEAKLAESEARLKRLDKDEFLYDRHFAVFAEEDRNIIREILEKRKGR